MPIMEQQAFDIHVLDVHPPEETARIVRFLREQVNDTLRKRGVVVGISGDVDSAVVLSLAVRAVGPSQVLALLFPDRESDPASETLAKAMACRLGVEIVREDITATLEGLGCYRRRDEAIRHVVPQYQPELGYRAQIVLPPDLLEAGALNLFHLLVWTPDGGQIATPLPAREFLKIMAASNFKQRTRMNFLSYYAESRNFAVVGATDRNQYMHGYSVKHSECDADITPIIHLYKTQVLQLAEFLDVPGEIRERVPAAGLYGTPAPPFSQMDLLLYALDHDVPASLVAEATGLPEMQVLRTFRDMQHRRQATAYLRTSALALKEC